MSLVSCVVAGLLSGALASGLVGGALQGRGPVRQAADPLDVVARDRRPRRRHRRFLEPRALGVGYDVIGDLLHHHVALQVAVAILAVKAVIWVVALGSGTSGGVLAPLLMMGAGLGVVLGHVLPGGEPALWPLVCMAATLGGMMRAPLTATVFAFGLTHDVNALLPLLAATLVAYGFTTVVMKRSIMTEKIARRGYHIYREYGVDPLERHHVDEVMSRGVRTIDAGLTVREALATYFGAAQTHRAYPAVRDGAVIGMVDRATLRCDGGSHRRSIALRGVLRHRRSLHAGRKLPAGRDAAGGARPGTAAGGRGPRDAAAGRHRVAQRSGEAVARPLRRRAQARALPANSRRRVEDAFIPCGPRRLRRCLKRTGRQTRFRGPTALTHTSRCDL